jgi:hypothetical protein
MEYNNSGTGSTKAGKKEKMERYSGKKISIFYPVLRIQDVYPGYRIRFIFFLNPGSGSASKKFSIFNPKN